ncbi:transposase [Streptomyces formicae]|uniref:transposase n=1 Tax=Streptomyces formicae TaxID=1616117 RepID=UPI002412BDB6|nr:transposase [Streptomyces formicae]
MGDHRARGDARPRARVRRARPEVTVSYVADQFKGFTSRVLRAQFGHLKSRMPTLWSSSYLAASAGAVSAESVLLALQRGAAGTA